MPSYLADTSALAKLYHREPGAEYMVQLIGRSDSRLYVSSLALLEFESVLAIKLRTKQIQVWEAEQSRRQLAADITARFVRPAATVTARHLMDATHLLRRFGVVSGLRAMDAIHATQALELYREGLVQCFLTADVRLFAVTRSLGVPVVDPAGREPSVALS